MIQKTHHESGSLSLIFHANQPYLLIFIVIHILYQGSFFLVIHSYLPNLFCINSAPRRLTLTIVTHI